MGEAGVANAPLTGKKWENKSRCPLVFANLCMEVFSQKGTILSNLPRRKSQFPNPIIITVASRLRLHPELETRATYWYPAKTTVCFLTTGAGNSPVVQ